MKTKKNKKVKVRELKASSNKLRMSPEEMFAVVQGSPLAGCEPPRENFENLIYHYGLPVTEDGLLWCGLAAYLQGENGKLSRRQAEVAIETGNVMQQLLSRIKEVEKVASQRLRLLEAVGAQAILDEILGKSSATTTTQKTKDL